MTSISNLGSLADALKQLQETFKKADTSGNGTLSKTELATALGDTAKGNDITTIFKQMDADGSGELTKEELTDGASLADKVREALLTAQEFTSGAAFLQMVGGGTSAPSPFSSGTPAPTSLSEDDTATDPYTTMLQQLIAKYEQAEKEAAAETPTTTTKNV